MNGDPVTHKLTIHSENKNLNVPIEVCVGALILLFW